MSILVSWKTVIHADEVGCKKPSAIGWKLEAPTHLLISSRFCLVCQCKVAGQVLNSSIDVAQ